MFFLYIFISILLIFFSVFIYKKIINPISLYLFIWGICIIIHQSGLIFFNKLSLRTWIVVTLAAVIYAIGCMVGKKMSKVTFKVKKRMILDNETKKQLLARYIMIISFISAVSIIPRLLYIIRRYGLNLITNVNKVYLDTISKNMDYVASSNYEGLIFIALVFAGIYIFNYGFKFFTLLPLLLLVVSQLSSGSRGSLLAGILLFSSTFIFKKKHSINRVKLDKKNKKRMFMLIGALFIIVILITYFRPESNYTLPYASDLLKKVSSKSKIFYSLIFYFGSPIAVLNEYLNSPIHSVFGASTFRVFYMLLNTIGVYNYDINFIGEYLFYTPAPSNVLTYIGELVYDFNFLGAYVIIFILGFTFSLSFSKVQKKNSAFWDVMLAFCFGLVSLSFFAWFLRLAIFWYVLLFGGILSLILDNKE